MNNEVFANISKIVKRDSKTTTYKFALLRGVIDIIQENSPHIKIIGDRAVFPLGLMVEKWLVFYYPLISNHNDIRQINGENNFLAFHKSMEIVITHYNSKGGLSAFYNDLRTYGIDKNINESFFNLVKIVKNTIVNMPMRYIGRSVSADYYSIFKYSPGITLKKHTTQNTSWLIKNCGTFSVPYDYYEAFKFLGSFISGTDNILFKWAEFSVNASVNINTEKALHGILKSPVTEREISNSKKLFKELLDNKNMVTCVWTKEEISRYDIDHIIPFSIYKNNELWNLLPAKSIINNQKRHKIPSPATIEKSSDLIIMYWEMIYKAYPRRFVDEIEISLLDNSSFANWQSRSLSQLKNTAKYLIETRGYEEWTY